MIMSEQTIEEYFEEIKKCAPVVKVQCLLTIFCPFCRTRTMVSSKVETGDVKKCCNCGRDLKIDASEKFVTMKYLENY
jgi:transcription elongation factor Elf1